jgi:hypothetical protein
VTAYSHGTGWAGTPSHRARHDITTRIAERDIKILALHEDLTNHPDLYSAGQADDVLETIHELLTANRRDTELHHQLETEPNTGATK